MCCFGCCTCIRVHRGFAVVILVMLVVAFGGASYEVSLLGQEHLLNNSTEPITRWELLVQTVGRSRDGAVSHYRTSRVAVLVSSVVWMAALVADLARGHWQDRCGRAFWAVAAAPVLHGIVYLVYAQVAFAYADQAPGKFVYAGGNMVIIGLYLFSLYRSIQLTKRVQPPASFSNPVAVSTIGTEMSTMSTIHNATFSNTEIPRPASGSSSSSSSTKSESPPPRQQQVTVAETHHI